MFSDIYLNIYNYFKYSDNSVIAINIFQVISLLLILFFLYKKLIKGTKSEQLVRGVFVLLFFWIVSEVLIRLNLQIWGLFLKALISIIAFSLIVIFQPELRRFLGYLGKSDFLKNAFSSQDFSHETLKTTQAELIEAVKYLSKTKTGALMVLQKNDDFSSYSEVGVKINGILSCELLLTIFHPNTPLHDGAVVINKNKIVAAGVLLPLTEDPKLSWKYGTRHRAAIGMTELSDCACLVVSEETGDISISLGGSLKKYDDIQLLRSDLELILGTADKKKINKKNVLRFIKIKQNKENKKIGDN